MVFNLYFVTRQLYWSALLRNRDKGKAAFFEHLLHDGHCLCQPLLHYALAPSLPPYSLNAWRVRKRKSCVQSGLCTQDCLTSEACSFWGTILSPSFISSSLGAGLWTRASRLYWDSFLRFCSTAASHDPKAPARGHLSHLPKPNFRSPASVPLLILFLCPFFLLHPISYLCYRS